MIERWIAPEQEPAALRALLWAYRSHNQSAFRDLLQTPSLAFSDRARTLGRWIPGERRIEINRSFVCQSPWLETLEVLRHEMAHQFVDEVLRVRGEPPHGPTFQKVCAERGIDGRASGQPEAPREVSEAQRKVERLLALAESADRHEAEAAMRRAQAILTKHNLDRIGRGEAADHSFRQLGTPMTRVHSHHRGIDVLLREHFFVDIIWVDAFVPHKERPGSVMEVSGTPENLDIAEYVHGFLIATAERLWHAHQTAHQTSGHARLRFMTGVVRGFKEKLDEAKGTATSGETGLVHLADAQLKAYGRRRHPRQSWTRGGGIKNDEALAAGRAAGRQIVLRKGVSTTVSSTGRLLGSGD